MKTYFFVLLVALFVLNTNVEAAKLSDAPAPTFAKVYVVKAGDCLYKIARANHMSVKELYQLNKKTIKDQRLIRIGQKLTIGTEPIEVVANENKSVSSSDTLVLRQTTSRNHLSANKFFGNPSLDSIVFILRSENIVEQNNANIKPAKEELSLVVKIMQVGIKMNPSNSKIYTASQIINSIKTKITYCDDKSFELSADGTKLCIRHEDYKKLLLNCYFGTNVELYPDQNPVWIISADQLGFKYNTKNTPYYDRTEIVASMMGEDGVKGKCYSQGGRPGVNTVNFTKNGKEILLDCSSFAAFGSNLYGEKAPGYSSAQLFSRSKRFRVKSIDDLKPGDFFGYLAHINANGKKVDGHVIWYLGKDDNGKDIFAHQTSKTTTFFLTAEQVEHRLKGRSYYACSPIKNTDLENKSALMNATSSFVKKLAAR